MFDPVYAAAERLGAPLYIHPQMPPPSVMDAYYKGFEPVAGFMLATAAVGWHYEAGLEFLRMVMGGVFDRFPRLQVMLGHWGEVVLFYVDRIAVLDKANLEAQAAGQGVLPTERLLYAERHLLAGLSELDDRDSRCRADHLLAGLSLPDVRRRRARAFLEMASISQDDRARIAHRNWEDLTSRIVRS